MHVIKLLSPFAFATSSLILTAGEASVPASYPVSPQWVPSLGMGYLHQLDADVDSGGSFSVDRANFDFGMTRVYGPGKMAGVSIGYGYHDYHFENMAVNPWNEVHSLSLAFPVRWELDDRWSLFALPSARANFENGADISDSVTGGMLAGATYKFSDRLSIGPGIGMSSELEDTFNVFPILLIRWKISDDLVLQTSGSQGASQGPGLALTWQAAEKWKFSLGARYERLRFRLDDDGANPDGVGEEKGLPVYLGVSYQISKDSELSFYTGVKFAASLEVDNSTGDSVYKSDHDAAPFVGLSWNAKF
ncbi:hypothetical protein NT6N_29250 [Oceaniferula spumae]|uniref:DUF6268 domain-containing protein n=1 Tax=Oceaniferula spumae TaxID=2979115 RepID=A0AAT9FPE6_9BACT